MERLELSHLAAPEPKSGASTNFATSAFCESADYTVLRQNCKRFLAINGRNVVQLKAFVGLQISPFALWQCAQFDASDADAFEPNHAQTNEFAHTADLAFFALF